MYLLSLTHTHSYIQLDSTSRTINVAAYLKYDCSQFFFSATLVTLQDSQYIIIGDEDNGVPSKLGVKSENFGKNSKIEIEVIGRQRKVEKSEKVAPKS